MTKIKGYPSGTAGKIGCVVLLKWSDKWWSAWDGNNRTWSTSALKALRLLEAA